MTGSRKRVRAAACAAGAPGVAAAACAASPHDAIDVSHDAIADIEELPPGLVDEYRQHQGLLYHDFSQDEVSPWLSNSWGSGVYPPGCFFDKYMPPRCTKKNENLNFKMQYSYEHEYQG